ncbi:MAG: hypothetical protein MUF38_09275 [Anaerolineae bacterium]|jgi:heme/copper-type cytochrome/quinol oxidase subunit 4|nr:hypothetical protein [Anaerolineae bacterium]
MADTFLMFPKNERYLRGEMPNPQSHTSQASYGCLMLFMVPFVGVGIFTIALTLMAFAENWDLENNSQSTTAVVVGRDEDYDEGSTRYYLYYDYTVNDTGYSDNQQVSEELYDRTERGQTLDIVYVTDTPGVSRIAGTDDGGMRMFLVVFTLFWNLIVILFVASTWWSWERQTRLRKEGKLVRGEIVYIESKTDSDGDYMIEAEVRFRTPTLQPVQGKRSYTSNFHKGQPLPRPGEQVSILYVDDKLWEIL